MTTKLPKQTSDSKDHNSDWTTQAPSYHPGPLARPVMPIHLNLKAKTIVDKHHHNYAQLAYSAKGLMHIETDEGLYILPPQQALWLPDNVPHTHYCHNEIHYRSLHFSPSITQALPNQVKTLGVSALLKELIIEMSNWPSDYLLDGPKQRLINVLIDQLSIAPDNQIFMPKVSDPRLLIIVKALTLEPNNKTSLEQWADTISTSTRTLNRLFNQHYGMGFSQWRQKQRILKSLDMLNDGRSTQYIADALGYESASAFNTAFKKQMQVSPRQFFLDPQLSALSKT